MASTQHETLPAAPLSNHHVNQQVTTGPLAGSWDPHNPVPDRWAVAGRIYVTTLNLLSLEVYYRHLPIYEETAR